MTRDMRHKVLKPDTAAGSLCCLARRRLCVALQDSPRDALSVRVPRPLLYDHDGSARTVIVPGAARLEPLDR